MTKRPSMTAALTAVLLLLGGQYLYQTLALRALQGGWRPTYEAFQWMSVGVQCLLLGLPVVGYYAVRRDERPAMRLRGLDPLCMLLLAVAAVVGTFALNWVSTYWTLTLDTLGLATSSGQETIPQSGRQLTLMLVTTALVPAVLEEFLFRGMVLPSMEPVGTRRAVLLCGLIFAMLHGRVEGFASYLLLSVVMGFLVIRTGSLWSTVITHLVYNATLIGVGFWIQTYHPEQLGMDPSWEDAVAGLPLAIGLMVAWVVLTLLAAWRGQVKRKNPLPEAARRRLPGVSVVLLVALFGVLIWIKTNRVLRMLAEGAGG